MHYHPRKENVADDALSKKCYVMLSHVAIRIWERYKVLKDYDFQVEWRLSEPCLYNVIMYLN